MEDKRQSLTIQLDADTSAFDDAVDAAIARVEELSDSLRETVKLMGAAGICADHAGCENVMREFIVTVAGNDEATKAELRAMAAVASIVADYGD